jgi:hypothetical protein
VLQAAEATESSATVSASSVALPAAPQTYGQPASPMATSLSLGSPTSTSFDTVTLSQTYTRTRSHTRSLTLSPVAASIAGGVATSAGYVKPSAPANTSIAGPVSFLGAGSNVQVALSTISLAILCMMAVM